MKSFQVDEDLVTLVWERAKPRPFENLSFSAALRRVLAAMDPTHGTNRKKPLKAPPISADELLAELDAWSKDELEKLHAHTKEKIRQRAASPRPCDWLSTVPELKSMTKLTTWIAICDHLGIKVGGDSARRKLREWVRINRPTWPAVPEPDSQQGDG